MNPSLPIEISVHDVHQLMDSDQQVLFIDCREPHEFELSRIEHTRLIPLGELPDWAQSTGPDDQRIVTICHHGVRSLRAAGWMRQNGFPNAQSMGGGIDQWSAKIDASVPRY